MAKSIDCNLSNAHIVSIDVCGAVVPDAVVGYHWSLASDCFDVLLAPNGVAE